MQVSQGGSIMLVKHVMTSPVVSIAPTATVYEATRLMVDRGLSGLPVIDGTGSLVGILSESDLLHRSELGTARGEDRWLLWLIDPGRIAKDYTQANARHVNDVMTRQVHTVSENAWLEEAVRLMERHRVKRLPVLRDGTVVGILTRADLVKALAELLAPPYDEETSADDKIKAALLAELTSQDWAPDSLEIAVKDRVVTLVGTIFDAPQRAAIRVAAENIPGVKRVDDRLTLIEAPLGVLVPDQGGSKKVS
jgi:CBS domain-containing protein